MEYIKGYYKCEDTKKRLCGLPREERKEASEIILNAVALLKEAVKHMPREKGE
jgi:hypothetical protein